MSEGYVDLSPVIREISGLENMLDRVESQVRDVELAVNSVAQEQASTRDRLEQLYDEFIAFLEKDQWTNEVSTARQELQLVRQELRTNFGQYDDVRHHATGILQAADLSVVRQDTMHTAVEGFMLSCPRYWLAPALLALSSWICDERPLAEKTLAEALRRDDSKVSLFFALVSRRALRMEACTKWLVRYFQLQNPFAMDREVVIMLDALANGVFGGGALSACSDVIEEWLAQLEEQAGFAAEQQKRWAQVLAAMTSPVEENEYPTLRVHSPTWPALEASLSAARRNQIIFDFFDRLFTGEIVVPPRLEIAVDDILDQLVKKFDDEELPLRRRERKNELIIEADSLPGRASAKRADADRRYQAESSSMQEQTSFAALLTNSAMFPEKYGASRATARYAVSRSRLWILSGYSDLVARARAQVPVEAELACGSWTGKSRDGENERELADDLERQYAERIRKAVEAVKIPTQTWAIAGGGVVLGALLIGTSIGWIVMLAAAGYFGYHYMQLDKARDAIRADLTNQRDGALRLLKAALAELVDLRRDIAAEDGKSARVLEFLNALSSTQYILRRPEHRRSAA
jgi:hypothetical protein